MATESLDMNETTHLWLGNQASFIAAEKALTKAEDKPNFFADSNSYDQEVSNNFMKVIDGVAVIDIKGSLVEGSAGYGIYYGALGYSDIRTMLASAVSNPNVSAILLNVGSGGGAVAGVSEAANLLERVNKVKPVVTYTGSLMASAALWLGVTTSYSYVADVAITGSLGIIRVHAERSKQLEADGIKVTVIRAGAEKALGSPYEPLSDKAKANMEAQAQYMYDIFLQHVADARGVSATTADNKFGQGREFIGGQAVQAGLIDKVGSYEDAFAKAISLGQAAKGSKGKGKGMAASANSANVKASGSTNSASLPDNQPIATESIEMSKPLTQEQLAAMAAGIDLPEGSAAETEGTPANAETTSGETTEPEAETEAQPAAQASQSADSAMTVLQNMLAKATEEAVTAKVEAKSAVTAFEALKAQADAFADIARASVKTMGLHFGVKAESVAAMSNDQVLAEHQRLSDLFKAKFKVGGVAATTQEEAPVKASVSPMFAAIVKKSTAK